MLRRTCTSKDRHEEHKEINREYDGTVTSQQSIPGPNKLGLLPHSHDAVWNAIVALHAPDVLGPNFIMPV